MAALSSVGLTELVHGIYRAQTVTARTYRESFINELLADLVVYPYTKETAMLGELTESNTSKVSQFRSTISSSAPPLYQLASP